MPAAFADMEAGLKQSHERLLGKHLARGRLVAAAQHMRACLQQRGLAALLPAPGGDGGGGGGSGGGAAGEGSTAGSLS